MSRISGSFSRRVKGHSMPSPTLRVGSPPRILAGKTPLVRLEGKKQPSRGSGLPHEIDILRKTVLNWRTSVRMDRKDAS